MAILSSKWLIGLLVVALVLLVLYLTGKKSVQAEIRIRATTDEVWAVLMDVPKVKEWNPVLIPLEGELKEGATLKYEFHQDDEKKATVMNAQVKQLIPNKLIRQKGGMVGLLTFDHQYLLEAMGEETRVSIREQYRGIMVPFWNPAPVEAAYERLLHHLKERMEQNVGE